MEAWKARVYASYREGVVEPRRAPWRRESSHAESMRRQYIQRYARFLPDDTNTPILDIGCGAGEFLDAVRSMGYTSLEGVDLSQSQIAAAAARDLTVTLAPAVEYLGSRPARYGLITAFSVLEHQTRAELFDMLDAIRSALVPGGRLLGVVPNAKGLFGAHVRFADITHELSFTPTSLIQIGAATGFELTDIVEHGPIVYGPVSVVRWTLWHMIRAGLLVARLAEGGDWRWPVFTQNLIFVARKPAGGDPA